MVRGSTVQDPIIWIVLLSSNKVSSRLPEVGLRRGVARSGVELILRALELGASTCTVTVNPTKLATALIATSWLIGARKTTVGLPRLNSLDNLRTIFIVIHS